MTEDYQNLPYETLNDLAREGDSAANKELTRRVVENIPDDSTGLPAVVPSAVPLGDDDEEDPNKNPDARKPHIWAVFVVWLLWKKISVIAEPAGIFLLFYAMYRIAYGVYYTDHDWGTPWGTAGNYAIAVILLVGLSKIIRVWMKNAWEKRPLTILLVIVALLFWYDGIRLV